MNEPDAITGQPVGEWMPHDGMVLTLDALRYRGKSAIVLEQSMNGGASEYRTIRCIKCVAAFYRKHKEVVIHRWLILPI